jgi:acyl carrier protein
VLEYICSELAADVSREDLTPDFPLIDNGVLDSISTFKLADFLKEEYRIAIEDADMTYQNLRSLAAITALVEARLAAEGRPAQAASAG